MIDREMQKEMPKARNNPGKTHFQAYRGTGGTVPEAGTVPPRSVACGVEIYFSNTGVLLIQQLGPTAQAGSPARMGGKLPIRSLGLAAIRRLRESLRTHIATSRMKYVLTS